MITLSNIEKSLGAFTLSIERLDIVPGEYLVILGPSGAGKTLLLLTVAGLVRPDRGEIFFNGTQVTALPTEKRDIGLVFQEANLFPHLNVVGNISFGKRYRKKNVEQIEQRIEMLVDMLNIRPLLHRTVAGLSGGEKQRVAVARALAFAPAILLMDEPLGLLDQNTREELRKELRRVHDDLGTTTLHVTHDRSEAFGLADRIAILSDGRLAQIASREEILARPVSDFVARFIGAENVFEAYAERVAPGRAFVCIGESRLPISTELVGKVRVCIHPEAIALHGEIPDEGDPSRFIAGALKSMEDEGTFVRIQVSCSWGEIIVSCGKERFLRSGVSCFSRVWLEPDTAAVHVFPASTENSRSTA
jgi:ABC-type Fe3+/spermidine/putrescine transport system ATPase subunit